MGEYIERKKAIELIQLHIKPQTVYGEGYLRAIEHATNKLELIPAADVQPIPQWISVKDRLPDTLGRGLSTMYSDCCLVCDAFGWVGMAYYITDGQKSWWEFADAQNKNKIDWTEVTHWMPLPEPPKDGDAK